MPQSATQAPPATGSFCWFDLNTRNVEAVKKFYGQLCGWTTTPSNMGPYHHWHDKDGVMFGGIMDMNSPEWADVPSHWMSYICVDDVDVKASKATELGGTVCVAPTDIPTVGRFCVINDSTGGALSLISLTQPKPIAPVIAWNELMTRDAAKAKSFYTKLLGWTTESMPMGGDVDYILCQNAGQMIGGIFQMSGPQFEHVPPHWLNYIATTKVDADAKSVEKLGGKIVVPPTDIPNNIGRFCVFSDPGGGHIALYQSTES
jgi:predicted enzyme related to lactoylglutathione lyase